MTASSAGQSNASGSGAEWLARAAGAIMLGMH